MMPSGRWLRILSGALLPLKPHLFLLKFGKLHYGGKPHIYRILFTIEGEMVKVLHIRHGRRRPVPEG
jgi:hypothetical protein